MVKRKDSFKSAVVVFLLCVGWMTVSSFIPFLRALERWEHKSSAQHVASIVGVSLQLLMIAAGASALIWSYKKRKNTKKE